MSLEKIKRRSVFLGIIAAVVALVLIIRLGLGSSSPPSSAWLREDARAAGKGPLAAVPGLLTLTPADARSVPSTAEGEPRSIDWAWWEDDQHIGIRYDDRASVVVSLPDGSRRPIADQSPHGYLRDAARLLAGEPANLSWNWDLGVGKEFLLSPLAVCIIDVFEDGI